MQFPFGDSLAESQLCKRGPVLTMKATTRRWDAPECPCRRKIGQDRAHRTRQDTRCRAFTCKSHAIDEGVNISSNGNVSIPRSQSLSQVLRLRAPSTLKQAHFMKMFVKDLGAVPELRKHCGPAPQRENHRSRLSVGIDSRFLTVFMGPWVFECDISTMRSQTRRALPCSRS